MFGSQLGTDMTFRYTSPEMALLTNETKYFKEFENVEWWILLLSSLMVVRTRVSEESRGLHCLPFRGAFFQSQILVGIVLLEL